jgi:XTP/dITP diphosphohydrolase
MELVIASNNPHKVRECREMLAHLSGLDLFSLHDFPSYDAPEESGTTFKENALIKAQCAVKTLNKWVIADDSGLVIPALNGAPGVYSARYANSENPSDRENRQKVLSELAQFERDSHPAYFECCVALVSPDGFEKCVTGICEGSLLQKERGNGGFGYDALFIKSGYTKTFAELGEATKNKISHRRKALDKIILAIESMTS